MSERGSLDGVGALCGVLLRQLESIGGISPGCRSAVVEILLGEGGGALHVLPAFAPSGGSAPFAAWRAGGPGDSGCVRIVLWDLSGECGESAFPLPPDLLARWPPNAILRVHRERLEGGELSGTRQDPAALYSTRELSAGGLLARPPRLGLVCLRLELEGDFFAPVGACPGASIAAVAVPAAAGAPVAAAAREAVYSEGGCDGGGGSQLAAAGACSRVRGGCKCASCCTGSASGTQSGENGRRGSYQGGEGAGGGGAGGQGRSSFCQDVTCGSNPCRECASCHLRARHLWSSLRRLACGGGNLASPDCNDVCALLVRCLTIPMWGCMVRMPQESCVAGPTEIQQGAGPTEIPQGAGSPEPVALLRQLCVQLTSASRVQDASMGRVKLTSGPGKFYSSDIIIKLKDHEAKRCRVRLGNFRSSPLESNRRNA